MPTAADDAAPMVPASSPVRPAASAAGTNPSAARRTVRGLALALVLAAGLAACGNSDDSATDTAGGSSTPPASTAAPASTGGSSAASTTTTPASGGSAVSTAGAGATASTAPGAAYDTVPEAQVAEMERTLDDIDQVLNDLDTDFTQDQD